MELVEACLAQIDKLESRIRVWVSIDRNGALQRAQELDTDLADGRWHGPLHGIPIGIKDIFDVAGVPTSAGSESLAREQAVEDATITARLKQAGAVILGKTVTTQFACFDPSPTRNPWNSAHTPGGSSSGSAAAVTPKVMHECMTYGTDTGCSPSSWGLRSLNQHDVPRTSRSVGEVTEAAFGFVL